MRKYIQFLIVLLWLCCMSAYGKRLTVGVQLNPVINYNAFNVSDLSLGTMKNWDIGKQIGIEANYRLNNKFGLAAFVKYYNKSQKIVQGQFFGYLNDGSTTWQKYNYESVDAGLLARYKLSDKKSSLSLLLGGSFSMAQLNKLTGGYHLHGDNPKTEHLVSIDFGYLPGEIGTVISMFHPLIGVRRVSSLWWIGTIEYGVLLYLPTKNMPDYSHDQFLTTNDSGIIHTNVQYQSRQYTTEMTIMYHLFSSTKKSYRKSR